MTDQSRARLLIATAFMMALYAWGLGFYGQAVFISELRLSRQWTASAVSGALTVYFVAGAVFLAWVPGLFARLGPRLTTIAGATILAASAAAMAMATEPWHLYLINIAMAIGWATTSSTAVVLLIAPWFGQRRGFAVSMALNGASAAGFLIAPPILLAIHNYGFNSAVPVCAALMLALIAPVLLFGARRPPENYCEPGAAAENAASPAAHTPADNRIPVSGKMAALRSRQFWLIAAPYALGMTAQVGFLMHQVTLLRPLIGPSRTGLAVAATTIAAVMGRAAFSYIADRADPRKTTAIIFLIQVGALSLILAGSQFDPVSPGLLIAGSAAFGISVGVAITLPALVISKEYAAASFGLVVGLNGAIIQFAFAFGPVLLGLLYDLSTSYVEPLLFCIVCELAAAALIMRRPQRLRA